MKTVFRTVAATFFLAVTLMLSLAGTQSAKAQNVKTTFNVCAYNVDGLPAKIAGISVNPDGHYAEGATKIGNYLLEKQYDIIGVSEDFDYNAELTAPLADAYHIGTWRGGVSGKPKAGLPLFNTDGLNFFCKKSLMMADEKWTPWNDANDVYDQDNDELIDKGYRFYSVALNDGIYVDVYIMHMDAGDSDKDIQARASQWKQLAEAVKDNTNGHPIIVMGDLNSRYTRDEIENLFINPLNSTGRLTVKDAWIELCKQGVYPTLGSAALKVGELDYKQGEIVDKVLYINRNNGIQLTATAYDVDETADQSDHKPLIVTFEAKGNTNQPVAATDWWVGEKLTEADQAAYIYNVAFKNFISNDNKASVTDINNAPLWYFRGTESGTVDNDSERDKKDGYRLHLEVDWKGTGNASVKYQSGTSSLTFTPSETTEGAYKFSISGKSWGKSYTKYFNENSDGAYSAANSKTTQNDWLLIGEEQKNAYNVYVAAYTEANKYSTNSQVSDELMAELNALLTAQTNYAQSVGDNGTTAQLTDIAARIKAYLDTTTAISMPTHAIAPATVTAIYGTDGKQRPALLKGINIVRMSDGTTKKIMK